MKFIDRFLSFENKTLLEEKAAERERERVERVKTKVREREREEKKLSNLNHLHASLDLRIYS